MELKVDQFCLPAPRPASDWVWSWKLNPVLFFAIINTLMHKEIISCADFFFCPHRGDSCQSGRIGQPVDEPFILFAMADSSYEMDAVTHCWAPKIRGQYIHNRTQMVWVRGHKLSHYLKLKLKTLWKPNEIYHFPVNTKCIHRRLLLTCNLQCQAALLPSPTTSVPLRVVCAVMLKMVDLEVFYLVALILFYSSVS